MKYSELNERQKKAFKNIKYAAYDLIGGLENTLLDYPEGHEEYIEAKKFLSDHEAVVNEVYRMATSSIYDEGACFFGNYATKMIRDINFCGKEFLMQCCEERVRKEGY